MRRGSATGANFTVADMTDQFFPDSGADVATPVFNLTSAYVMYPTRDRRDQLHRHASRQPQLLAERRRVHGDARRRLDAGREHVVQRHGPAGGTDGELGRRLRPRARRGLELPGSGGSPATIAYTLGATGTTLTFTNVVTRTKASLTADGTLAIFTRLNTSGGTIASIDYIVEEARRRRVGRRRPPRRSRSTIGSDGGYMSFHVQPSWQQPDVRADPGRADGHDRVDRSPRSPRGPCAARGQLRRQARPPPLHRRRRPEPGRDLHAVT